MENILFIWEWIKLNILQSGFLNFIVSIMSIFAALIAYRTLQQNRKIHYETQTGNIEIEIVYIKRTFLAIRFTNTGLSSVYKMNINLDEEFINSVQENEFKDILKLNKNKTTIVAPGKSYDLYFGTNLYLKSDNKSPIKGNVTYMSLGKIFEKEINLEPENYMTFFSVKSYEEDLIDAINNLSNSIIRINKKN